MIEFYPQIKAVHVAAVLASGLLFALRGVALLAGQHWPAALAARATSWAIDTTLLTAALMLFTLLPKEMFGNGWLLVKLVLIVAYVGLGTLAMRRRRSRAMQAAGLVAALGVYAFMIGVARAHHPLGPLVGLLGAAT